MATAAGDGATLARIEKALKYVYLPTFERQFVRYSQMLSRVLGSRRTTGGLKRLVKLHVGGTTALNARGAPYAIGPADYQKTEQAEVDITTQYLPVQFDGPAVAACKGDPYAAYELAAFEFNQGRSDFMNELEREFFGSTSGFLGQIAEAATTYTNGQDIPLLDNSQAKHLRVNMRVDVVAADGTPLATGGDSRVITNIDTSTSPWQIDLDVAGGNLVTTDTNPYYFVHEDNYGNEWAGLEDIVLASGTYMGIARASNPWWQSIVDSTTDNIGDTSLQGMLDNMVHNSYGGRPRANLKSLLMITTPAIRLKYYQYLNAKRQIVNKLDLGGGFSAIGYDYEGVDIPIVVHTFCPANTLYLIDTSAFELHLMSGLVDLMDTHGHVLDRIQSNDAYWGAFKTYSQILCRAPGKCAKFTNITKYEGEA